MHNRQKDGGYALIHSLYDYDGGRHDVLLNWVGSFSLIKTSTHHRKDVPIVT